MIGIGNDGNFHRVRSSNMLKKDKKRLFFVFDVLFATIYLVDSVVKLVLRERRLEFYKEY